jgi:hypothetical protein
LPRFNQVGRVHGIAPRQIQVVASRAEVVRSNPKAAQTVRKHVPLGAPTEMPPLPEHQVCGENGALHVRAQDYDRLRSYAHRLEALRASPSEAPREGATPRTKAQCLTAVVKELGLDTTDPFTRVLAAAFALQDAYDESRAALTRCQQIVHEQAAPGRSEEK